MVYVIRPLTSLHFSGTIRGCLMIESVLAACEIEDMLFELREHSLGLNCGMWDYAASFISKFCKYPVNFNRYFFLLDYVTTDVVCLFYTFLRSI